MFVTIQLRGSSRYSLQILVRLFRVKKQLAVCIGLVLWLVSGVSPPKPGSTWKPLTCSHTQRLISTVAFVPKFM